MKIRDKKLSVNDDDDGHGHDDGKIEQRKVNAFSVLEGIFHYCYMHNHKGAHINIISFSKGSVHYKSNIY